MKILVYSKINDHNIEEHLGLPEYSYYFVLREFLPCLRELAEVVIIENPQQQVDEIYQNSAAQNEACVFLSFTPPHTTVIDLKCPTVCVFAWEFSNIPNEPWNGSEKNDWSWVLRKLRFAITHSQSAKQAILHAVGSEFPVCNVPSPVWNKFADFRSTREPSKTTSFELELSIDSRSIDLESIDPLSLGSSISAEYYQYAVGLIEQRDQELLKLNQEFAHAEDLVAERDEQLEEANKERHQQLEKANLEREYAEKMVQQRDQQLEKANLERGHAEKMVQQRDQQLEEANLEREYAEKMVQQRDEQLEQRNRDCHYAESVVEKRDLELTHCNEACQHAEQVVKERDIQVGQLNQELYEFKSTYLGRLNGWLLRRRNQKG